MNIFLMSAVSKIPNESSSNMGPLLGSRKTSVNKTQTKPVSGKNIVNQSTPQNTQIVYSLQDLYPWRTAVGWVTLGRLYCPRLEGKQSGTVGHHSAAIFFFQEDELED